MLFLIFDLIILLNNQANAQITTSIHENTDWCLNYSNKCQICNEQTISCNNINMTLESPFNLSPFTRSISLAQNRLFSLDFSFASNTSLLTLEHLNLAENSIRTIETNRFFEQMPNLQQLILANNSLKSFSNQKDDILCTLNKLSTLNLENNQIEQIDFSNDCIHNSNLNSLNLKANKLKNLNANFINKLKLLRARNVNFTVMLGSNEFKCNCGLLSFYRFLKENQNYTRPIVTDFSEVKCDDTWSLKLNQKLIDSNLEQICDHTSQWTTLNPAWRWKTTHFTIISTNRAHMNPKTLFIFVVATFLFGCCVLLLVKPKFINLKPSNVNQSFETSSRAGSRMLILNSMEQNQSGRPKTLKQWTNYIFKSLQFSKNKVNFNSFRRIFSKKFNSSRHHTAPNIEMRRLSEESLNFVDTNPNIICGKSTTSVLKVKQQSESDEETEREEESIMDTIVRQDSSHFKYKRIKALSSHKTDTIHPNIFAPFS